MRKKKALSLTTLVVMLCLLFPFPALALDAQTDSIELIDNAKDYDKQTIIYRGEVIGDILRRGEYAWVQVSDGGNVISVWVEAEAAAQVKHIGRYDMRGDTVVVTGVFHRACAEHGGDVDIHAVTIQVVESGYIVSRTVSPMLVVTAAVLLAAAAILAVHVMKKCK